MATITYKGGGSVPAWSARRPASSATAPVETSGGEPAAPADAAPAAQVGVNAAQLDLLDRFQREMRLATREVALGLLLDIAFEAVTSTGRRFWDKPVVGMRARLGG